MDKQQFLERISLNGKLIPKRSTEQYLCKYNLLHLLIEYTNDIGIENPSIIERLIYLKTGENKCSICGNPTTLNDNGTEFRKFCSRSCYTKSSQFKEKLSQHNLNQQKVTISKEELYDLYWNKEMSLIDMGKLFNISNVSIKNRMKKLNIPFRTHAENQKLQYESKKENIIQNNVEKYGVEHLFQSEEIKEKIKQINIQKYGVEYPFQSKKIHEKVKQTNIERYGVENVFQLEEIKEKIKQTNLEKYGVEHPLQSEEIKEKIKQTNLEKYGVENPLQSEEIREQIKQTNIERYGVESHSQIHLRDILPLLNSKEWWNSFNNFVEIKQLLNGKIGLSNLRLYAHKYRPDLIGNGITLPHQKIIDLLNDNNIIFTSNNRTLISPLELDIFIPDKNIAMEVNGVFWHSENQGKDRNYHLNKLKLCERQRITLLQFLDIEINNNWNLVESMIKNKINLISNKIGARQCEVFYPSKSEEERFFSENHIQGYTSSSICIGLNFNNMIVSMMSFKKPRFNKNYEWELLRFCNKKDYVISGAASKLFKYRPKGNIISYSNKRYSIGNLYKVLGFKWLHDSGPDYFYTKDYKTLYHRTTFQKYKLSTLLEDFNSNLTEWENMQNNGYDRIWDCGNSTWIL